jgi:hypothetical protein
MLELLNQLDGFTVNENIKVRAAVPHGQGGQATIGTPGPPDNIDLDTLL